ncbi:Smt3-specific protease [Ascosphaera acerosa]|nr:Smt3-specific protease [Ascosphaera acerosa]
MAADDAVPSAGAEMQLDLRETFGAPLPQGASWVDLEQTLNGAPLPSLSINASSALARRLLAALGESPELRKIDWANDRQQQRYAAMRNVKPCEQAFFLAQAAAVAAPTACSECARGGWFGTCATISHLGEDFPKACVGCLVRRYANKCRRRQADRLEADRHSVVLACKKLLEPLGIKITADAAAPDAPGVLTDAERTSIMNERAARLGLQLVPKRRYEELCSFEPAHWVRPRRAPRTRARTARRAAASSSSDSSEEEEASTSSAEESAGASGAESSTDDDDDAVASSQSSSSDFDVPAKCTPPFRTAGLPPRHERPRRLPKGPGKPRRSRAAAGRPASVSLLPAGTREAGPAGSDDEVRPPLSLPHPTIVLPGPRIVADAPTPAAVTAGSSTANAAAPSANGGAADVASAPVRRAAPSPPAGADLCALAPSLTLPAVDGAAGVSAPVLPLRRARTTFPQRATVSPSKHRDNRLGPVRRPRRGDDDDVVMSHHIAVYGLVHDSTKLPATPEWLREYVQAGLERKTLPWSPEWPAFDFDYQQGLSTDDWAGLVALSGFLTDLAIYAYLMLVCHTGNQATPGRYGVIDPALVHYLCYNEEEVEVESLPGWRRAAAVARSCQILFFPVNVEPDHWALAVYQLEARQCVFLDSRKPSKGSGDILLHLEAWLNQQDLLVGGGVQRLQNVSPKQDNDFDCGVFVCANARLVGEAGCLDGSPRYSQREIPGFWRHLTAKLRLGVLFPGFTHAAALDLGPDYVEEMVATGRPDVRLLSGSAV